MIPFGLTSADAASTDINMEAISIMHFTVLVMENYNKSISRLVAKTV